MHSAYRLRGKNWSIPLPSINPNVLSQGILAPMALLGDLCNLKALPMMFTPSRAPAGTSKLVGEQSLTEGCKVGSMCHRALPLLKAGSKAGATQARGSAEESQGLHWSHPFMEQETKVALRGAPHIKHFLLCPGRGVRL